MKAHSPLSIRIIDNACYGKEGLTGGDRIFIELSRRWAQQGNKISIFASRDGYNICMRENLKHENIEYSIWWERGVSRPIAVPLSYLARSLVGVVKVLMMKEPKEQKSIVYSASDFWPDSLPGFFMKLKDRKAKWVAGFYLFTPRPWSKESVFKGEYLWRGLASYIGQLLVYRLIKRYADMVFVTSEPDVEKFITKNRDRNKVIAVRGGVDTRLPTTVPEPREKSYDAVFIGRFHSQKGVLELVDIWRYVCEWKKDAKLAIVGLGPLEAQLRDKIAISELQDNISILGYQDGIPKIQTCKSSRVVLHPAIYDSGGMAACEAMACGLPGVSFDLKALKTYYPKGMLKTPCFDSKEFAQNIIRLLEDDGLYNKTQRDALDWAREWDWDKRAEEILDAVNSLFLGREEELC